MKSGAMKFVRRLFVLLLIVVTMIAIVSSTCDFDTDACDTIRIVADLQMNAGGSAGNSTPSRVKAGNDTGGSDLSDSTWGAIWMTDLPHAGVPDAPPKPAWYARQVALDLASDTAKVPNPPPKI